MFLFYVESICFYFMWKQTHFPSRDFIQQEVLNSRKADSQFNHKTPQLWRDVITNSYCVNVMRRPYDIGQPQNATAVA